MNKRDMKFNSKVNSDKIKTLKKIHLSLKNVFWITKYSMFYLPFTLAITVILGVLPTLSTRVMQRIINELQIGSYRVNDYIFFVSVYIALDIISVIISSIYSYYKQKFSANFDKSIRLEMQEKASQITLKDYENNETYNTINRAQNQNGNTILSFVDSFSLIVKNIVTIISTVTILSGFHLEFMVYILIVPVFKYLFSLKIIKLQYLIVMKRTEKERKIWYIDYLFMMGIAFKEIKLYGLREYLSNQYKELKKEIIKQDINIAKKSLIFQTILSFIDQIICGGIFYFYIVCGIKKIILIGDVITYTKCIFSVKNNIESILSVFQNIAQSALSIDFIFQFLEMEIDEDDKKNSGTKKISDIESITISNLSYKYPGSEQYALKNISLEIKKDDSIVIIGRNGSGKSTFSKILLGFYLDYEGIIKINDIDLKELDIETYQSLIGCVFQDYIKYETTIRENIGFGDLNNIDNDKKIKDICKYLNLTNIISDLNGIDTMLGSWFGKKQVSIGQWQRLAIARAIFKDPSFYVFDEPDASLDLEAENKLIDLYCNLFNNKIGIFITHKVGMAHKISKRIFVFDNGSILENGSHKELMNKKGLYYKLYIIQNEKYEEDIL